MPGRSALVKALLLLGVLLSPTLAYANPRVSPTQQSPTADTAARQEDEARLLEAGKPIERALRGGETHVYQVRMEAAQFLHTDVVHRGVNVYVAAYDPDGKLVRAVFTISGNYGLEPVSVLAEVSGNYRLEVHALEKDAPAGNYAVEIKKLGSPTEQDRARLAAEDAFLKGLQWRVLLGPKAKQEALKQFESALLNWHAVGDRYGEALTLQNMGLTHFMLGENQKALDRYNQALPLVRAVGDRSVEATTLNGIGLAYDTLGEEQKALDYYNRALLLRRAVGDRAGEGMALNNIGVVYNALGEKQKALGSYNQALPLRRAVRDRAGEAITLANIGINQALLGQNKEALDNYLRALALAREVRDPLSEGNVLSNLMDYWRSLGNPSLAIFIGKQAVNAVQQIRRSITGLEEETQRSFLKSKEGIYRDLVELLISEGRLFEAQQVLGLLKVQEYLDFTRATRAEAPSATSSIALTRTEIDFGKRYEAVTDQIAALGREWSELSSKASRTPEEERRFQDLSAKLDSANRALQGFFEDLYSAFGKSREADKEQKDLQRNASDMQSILQGLEPGTVALYTLVALERIFVLVVTPDAQVARQSTISAHELRDKVFKFWKVLRSGDEDPLPPAQELYRILIGPGSEGLGCLRRENSDVVS